MTYNIHPIFVHFPIALLFLYSLIKIFPFKKWFPKVSWKHIEILLLVVGVLGAFTADYTGGIAKHLLKPAPNRQLLEIHSLFAEISSVIYSAILLGEMLYFFTPWINTKLKSVQINSLLLFIQDILTSPLVSNVLAILGLVAISITGLLGGAIVYGISADPFAVIVLHLFGIN
jgi:uncharacterized membrane protein